MSMYYQSHLLLALLTYLLVSERVLVPYSSSVLGRGRGGGGGTKQLMSYFHK